MDERISVLLGGREITDRKYARVQSKIQFEFTAKSIRMFKDGKKKAMNSCINCKFAAWEMTAHNPPRINKNHYGTCQFRTPLIGVQIPKASSYALHDIERYLNHHSAIWADRPHIDCPCFEAKS